VYSDVIKVFKVGIGSKQLTQQSITPFILAIGYSQQTPQKKEIAGLLFIPQKPILKGSILTITTMGS